MFPVTRTSQAAGTRASVHAVPTLLLVVKGQMTVTVERRRYTLGPGCALFRPAGVRAAETMHEEVESFLIELDTVHALPAVVAETTARGWSLNLIRELEVREPAWKRVTEGLTLAALGHLERRRLASNVRPAWLDHVVVLAREHYTLAEIATTIGRHPSHIAREFRRHEGVSVGEYARRCRLEIAARTLSSSDRPISAVALASGFCDQSHFTNAFHRLFGVTPAAYRQSARARP